MKKSTRIVKRLLALFLVVLMSINSLGAVVSDNDGSAFITKAEFDSLKNDFQSQIDQYNTSIDAKIDGAIAGYLAGIKIQSVEKIKPEFNGMRLLVTNIEKIDNLKFGRMDFKVNATMINMAQTITDNGWDETAYKAGHSSGAGMVLFERVAPDGKHGSGFEVFRCDRNNRLCYFNDLRFLWSASIFLAAGHGSAYSLAGDKLYLRWHGWYNGKQTSQGDSDAFENDQGLYYSDLLCNKAWLGFHQSGGIGIWCTSWGVSDNRGMLTNYQTSVNAFDTGNKYIICTNGTAGIVAPNICTFSSDDWTTDLLTQQESMYDYYDVSVASDYRYNLPSDAGLTSQQAVSWTMNDWRWFDKSNASYYHSEQIRPTYISGINWTRYGTYAVLPSEYTTTDNAQDFYELTIKLGDKELDLLKNDVALEGVSGTYNGWEGYLYQGLPLYSFSQAGKIVWEIDLSSVTEDLYLIVRDQPLGETLNASNYVDENLDSKIDSIKIDNSVSDKAGVILTAGSNHVVTIDTNAKTDIFYKLVPVDVNSKLRNVVFVPTEITFESAS